ncbi:MAG: 7-cyano-7-deazaguanine synthase [Phycisphaeraceae bacterium]|nr:7-cyano-7-deazaguanine synthase [Phycisphaeraceae bacterium]
MAASPTLILSNGGLRSLVAMACLSEAGPGRRLIVAHLAGHHGGSVRRALLARKQAEHFKIRHFRELTAPRAKGSRTEGDEQSTMLWRSSLLLAGMDRAVALRAEELIWPAQQSTGGPDAATLLELAMTVEHLASIETSTPCRIRAPLLDLTDVQILELSIQLQVPLELSWSCQGAAAQPCRACPGCRRRIEAFDRLGVVDPLNLPRRASA